MFKSSFNIFEEQRLVYPNDVFSTVPEFVP